MRPLSRGSRVARPRFFAACAAALVAFVALVACHDDGASSSADAASALPCAVDDVLARRCRECHAAAPRYGAPMALMTHDDLAAPAPSDGSRHVFEEVSKRIHDSTRRMPQPPNPPLTDTDAKVLDDWIARGAPRGTEACAPSANANANADAGRLACTPDTHIRPAVPYRPPSGMADALVCYGFETSRAAKRHIIGLAPAIGSSRHLHHVTLLRADTPVSPEPAPCSPDAMTTWRSLYGWAPGTGGLELPREAGLPDEPGSHYVVQLHYVSSTGDVAVEDASGFDLCTTEELRPNDADVMAFGTTEITVPARSALSVDCSVPVPADGTTTHLFAAFPHMHQIGRSIRSVARPGGSGDPVDLGTVSEWNLGNQSWLPIDYTLRPGDVVETHCAWQNPSDHGVGYGPTAEDEMCFSFVMYYPRIDLATWHWSLPALYSTCH